MNAEISETIKAIILGLGMQIPEILAQAQEAQESACQIPIASYSFRDHNVYTDRQTDGQMDMAISTRLVILIKNIYTLWGRKRFLLPVTYFPTNIVYPFTPRVTGIKRKSGALWATWCYRL